MTQDNAEALPGLKLPTKLQRPQSCGRCRHSNTFKDMQGKIDFTKRLCQRRPPKLFLLPGPNNSLMFQPAYPPVDPQDKGCGEFEPSLDS